MPFFFTRAFWRELRFTGLLFLLLGGLIVQRSCSPAVATAAPFSLPARPAQARPTADTSRTVAAGSLERKALPRSRWQLVPGPAYLVYPLPRKPKQAVLDYEAARAAQLHKI